MSTPGPFHHVVTLVGREREQATLRDHLAAAVAGRGSLVLIGGAAGIGKTALGEALCAGAVAQGVLPLVGRCYDLADTPPYGPWLDLFARYHPAEGDPPLPESFAQRGTIGAVSSQAMLFQQVVDFLAALTARRPVVALLDDLHWADQASLDLLRFVVRTVGSFRLLLLATYRADELARNHPFYAQIPVLAHDAQAARLDLRPLAPEDVRAWLAPRYPLGPADSARLIDYLQARAEGNPFYLSELLRALEEEHLLYRSATGWVLGDLAQTPLPGFLRQVIHRRLARLDEASRRLLAIAAIIGHEVPLELWALVAGVDEDAVLEVIDQGLEIQLLRESADGTRAQFAHALIRAALYEGTPATRRLLRHRRIAEALTATAAPDPDVVAYHFQQAGDERTAIWLGRAGERAQAAYAWTTAIARYKAALAHQPDDEAHASARAQLCFRLGVLLRYSDYHQSSNYLSMAARLAQQNGDRGLLSRIQLYHGLVLCYMNDFTAGLAQLEAGDTLQEALSPAERERIVPMDAVDATINCGMVIMWNAAGGNFTKAEVLSERFLATLSPFRATGLTMASTAGALLGRATIHAYRGRPDAARRDYEQAHDLYRAIGHLWMVGFGQLYMLRDMTLPYCADNIPERERVARNIEEALTRMAVSETPLAARIGWVPVLAVAGRWAELREICNHSHLSTKPDTVKYLAEVAFAQADYDLVALLVAAWLPAGLDTPLGSVRYICAAQSLQRLAAYLSLIAGDSGTARAWLSTHDRWLASSGAVLGQAEGQVAWAQYYRASGETQRAWACAESAVALATTPRQPLALLAAHRLAGELAMAAAQFAAAQVHLDAALALADACAAPYERALTLLAFAELRHAEECREEARKVLATARALLVSLDAPPALARADLLGRRLVVPTNPPPDSALARLTVREIEVLRLVVAGQTNAQIAAALHISANTVLHHITHILNKTGTDNRTAAVAFALRHGLG